MGIIILWSVTVGQGRPRRNGRTIGASFDEKSSGRKKPEEILLGALAEGVQGEMEV